MGIPLQGRPPSTAAPTATVTLEWWVDDEATPAIPTDATLNSVAVPATGGLAAAQVPETSTLVNRRLHVALPTGHTLVGAFNLGINRIGQFSSRSVTGKTVWDSAIIEGDGEADFFLSVRRTT